MFSSSGGPTVVVALYRSRALVIASFGPNSGVMSLVSKKAPWFVPWLWSRPAATEMIHQ